jgi:hypothetical protein
MIGRFYSNSKVPDIVAMLHKSIPYKDIAKAVGCTEAYVCAVKTKRISGRMRFTIEAMRSEHLAALHDMASASGVTTAELARAILIDAAEEEIEVRNACRS